MREDDSERNLSFGELVQQRRRVLGLTRVALAQRVGCSPVTIKKLERDERRPSQQLAELLADHLRIAATERSRFVRMARGELEPSFRVEHRAQVTPLPTGFRAPSPSPAQEDFPFVGREAELAQLQTCLDQALQGSSQVVFITGEAGSGKSALAQKFARQSQEAHPELVVATGHCNAYTGVGDPYLPFREILDLLTGDIEYQAAGHSHPDHTRRLWQIMPTTLQALMEIGRDLLGTFIPVRRLLDRLAGYIGEGANGLTSLHRSIEAYAEKEESAAGKGHTQQSALFEQYSRVIMTVARHAPLILILDDLQWADTGSINLLFHLAHHRASKHLLIVGIYRPTDVALGRDGERHPLEPVVNELQRHIGNSPIDLTQSEGRAFVEALLDAQPNRLGADFREALFMHTGGHALFTVEMLRGLQGQGIIKGEQGQWVQGSHLNWRHLPARVEGIIKEQLSRLPPALQESLRIASVEGEVFTAEIVANVQGVHTSELIGQLSNVLDRQQDLIRVLGVRRLDSNGQSLSQYRFRHILFQRFLYEGLDEVKRVFLHRAVGQEIERLYAGQTDAVALQLARHFAIAGDDRRALAYFMTAGDVAAAAYANAEAIAHYNRAIERSRQATVAGSTLIHLYTRLGRVLELDSQFDEALATYETLNRLARERGDRTMELSALTAQSTLYSTLTPLHDPVRGQALLEEALILSRAVNNQAAEAKILGNLTTLHLYNGHAAQGMVYGEQSLALARTLNLREQMAFTLNDLGLSYYAICHAPQAKAALDEARDLWRELGNMPMLADNRSAACTVHVYSGEYEQAIAFSQEAYEISQAAGNLWGQAYSRAWVGYAYWQLGTADAAVRVMEECIRLAKLSGFAVPLAFTQADLALVFGSLGAVEQGLALAQEAQAAAERQVPLFSFHVSTRLAQLQLLHGDLAAAETHIHRAKDEVRETPFVMFYGTLLTEAELALRRRDYGRTMVILDEVLPDLRRFEIRIYLAPALYLQAHAYRGLGDREAAQSSLQAALAAALATGSRVELWPICMSLSRLVTDPAEADSLRRQAQAIVESIAAHTPTPELKAAFLSLPKVRAVFEP